MRIKIDDKIYRLKEIESGVDSLMELVEEPRYKDGDFVVSEFGSILIFKEADGGRTFDHAYLPVYGELVIDKVAGYYGVKRHATTEEKQRMIDALAEQGKRWNNDKKCIEDIQKRKFKAGDKVRIKDGISSKTQGSVYPYFVDFLDQYKVMTVKKYITTDIGEYITTSEAKRGDHHFGFAEDWLEPWSDEPKVGDWVIFWDHIEVARIGMLTDIRPDELEKYVVDHLIGWNHAVKWDGTIEHLEKVMKGEL
jgi:hypothetical protein